MLRSRVLAAVLLLVGSSGCTSTVTGTDPVQDVDGGSNPTSGDDATTDDTSSSEYDALFGPPDNTALTEDSLYGLWAGSTLRDEVRVQFAGDSILVALKCGAKAAVGLSVAASVTADSIRILESKSLKNEYEPCSLKVSPVQIPACAAVTDIGCFTVSGSLLDFSGVALFTSEGYSPNANFTKLSD